MCFIVSKQKTIEELIAGNSAGMTDAQKAQYWYELSQSIFALLGKVDVGIIEITPAQWQDAAMAQYPTLTEIKIADSKFFTTDLISLQKILSLDWTNLVLYIAEIGDCDKFAARLFSHLCDFYKINAVVPVWGDTTQGYHAFNLAVVLSNGNLMARLIEPQTDAIFIEEGPLGKYIPRKTAEEFGIKKLI